MRAKSGAKRPRGPTKDRHDSFPGEVRAVLALGPAFRASLLGQGSWGKAAAWSRAVLPGGGSAPYRDDLHPAVVAFAFALGDDTFELGQGHVNHAAVPGVHRFEGDDLAELEGFLAELAGHRRQVVVAAAAVAFGVDQDVPLLVTGPVDHAVGQELQRLQNLALLADDARGILANDLDADLVGAVLFGAGQDDLALDFHVFDDVGDELQRECSSFVGRFDADWFGSVAAFTARPLVRGVLFVVVSADRFLTAHDSNL